MNKISRLTGTFLITLLCVPFGALAPARAAAPPPIVINELMWMGSSLSSSDEWIELSNTSNSTVDLVGWRLTRWSNNEETNMLTIASGTIMPGGFFLIANYASDHENSRLAIEPDLTASAVSLSNSTLRIALYDADGQMIDVAGDGGKPLGGQYVSGEEWASMERKPGAPGGEFDTSWYAASESVNFKEQVIEMGTPGAPNSNIPPLSDAGEDQEAVVGETVAFDGSGSSDPEGAPLAYTWDFGDDQSGSGVATTHAYVSAGEYTVTLSVSDGVTEAEDDLLVTVEANSVDKPKEPARIEPSETHPISPTTTPAPLVQNDEDDAGHTRMTSGDIIISELLPNPDGSDAEGEFIELMNIGDEPVDLYGWTLRDPKTSYGLDIVIKPDTYAVIPRTDSDIALNNAGDTVFLDDAFGKPINGVEYGSGASGKSFARDGVTNSWQWAEPTPGEENIFPEEDILEDNTAGAAEEGVEINNAPISIAEARERPKRDKVIVTGVVTVLPGMFGQQYFYIQDESAGVQVYSSKSAFPTLSVGNTISVNGSTSEAHGEWKINVSTASDISVLGSGASPDPLAVGTLDEDLEGMLVEVDGTVLSKHGRSLDAQTDQGVVTVTLKRSTGMSMTDVKADDHVVARGIVSEDVGAYALLPRSVDDMDILKDIDVLSSPGAVAGVSTTEAAAAPAGESVEETAASEQGTSSTIMIGAILAGAAIVGVRWTIKNRDRVKELLNRIRHKNSPSEP